MATIQDFVIPIQKLLGNRTDVPVLVPEAVAEACIELGNDYPFEELRETGPTVQFITGQNEYAPSYFLNTTATPAPTFPRQFNKVISWFFYLQPPVNLTGNPNIGYANPGYSIIFRDIMDLEVLINTASLPQFWTQLGNGNLYVGATPTQSYFTYMRYQFLHAFTEPAPVVTDPVLLPQNWFDIINYYAAEKIALQLRMEDVATRYHNIIYGDPKGQGNPGLIMRRISQTRKNQSRSTRSVRMVGRGSY